MDLRPVIFVVGIMLTTLAAAMLAPAFADLIAGHPDWIVFVASSGVTLFAGGAMVFATFSGRTALNLRQAFLMTSLSWMTVSLFAALPFTFSDLNIDYTDAVFEAVSGITTTGSTVIVGLDFAPPGILLWRAILQWLGGIGIIVTAVAVLPMLQVGGMQLFRMESSDRSEKALPRAAEIAAGIATLYILLTIVCAIALWLAGLTPFEAVAHAMTTIATGGFSTSDNSIGYFQSASVDVIVIVGMILGSLPFVLYLSLVRGRARPLLRDPQVRWFFCILAVFIVALTGAHAAINDETPLIALRYVAFNVVSIMTGTGFSTTDYDAWGTFATSAFFFLMFIGGCAGSTTCGIKIFRFQVLYAGAKAQMSRLVQPHGVFIPYYDRKPIPQTVVESVMAFFFVYAASFALLAIVLGMMGLDFVTAASGAATAISNVGPGLGSVIGPTGTFAALPDEAKWALCAGMLLGRLELFTVLVLLSPRFWRS